MFLVPAPPPPPFQGAQMFRGCRGQGLHLDAPHGAVSAQAAQPVQRSMVQMAVMGIRRLLSGAHTGWVGGWVGGLEANKNWMYLRSAPNFRPPGSLSNGPRGMCFEGEVSEGWI